MVMPGVISAPRRGASARPTRSVSVSDPMFFTVTVSLLRRPPPSATPGHKGDVGQGASSGVPEPGLLWVHVAYPSLENLGYCRMRMQYSEPMHPRAPLHRPEQAAEEG